ncbi:MAG: DUF1801 domain-containing protein, partial [Hyphomicrobiales bacterium]
MAKDSKPERTVDQYIAALPPDVAFIMERIREALHEMAPDLRESIRYTMPLFRYEGTYLYVGAWKKHIGLYPVFRADPELEAAIAPYRAKKDTVQFK